MMREKARSIDVAVIGAGTGGCSAAIAAARAGLRVLIIEREAAADVGRKVCGNAVGLDAFDEALSYVTPPTGPEIAASVEGGTLFFGATGTGIPVQTSGVVVNRLLFGQRLLADALSAGAELLDRCSCVGWADRKAVTVRVKPDDGGEGDIAARVVVDASGYRSVLTRSGGPLTDDAMSRSEAATGYREILSLREPIDEATGGCAVLSLPGARHGYAWVFPMGGRLANVGIGAALDCIEGSLKDTYDAFLGSRPELEGAEVVSSGAGMLPFRRPLAALVGDGFMSVGDAGCQASPLHGGGIIPSILAGVMAGEQAATAIGTGATDAVGLWDYGLRFMRTVGHRHAAHEVLRDLVYSLSADDQVFLTDVFVRSGGAIRAIRDGAAFPSVGGALRLLAPFVRRPALARRLTRAARLMSSIRRHYLDYPCTPLGLGAWTARVALLRRSIGYHSESR